MFESSEAQAAVPRNLTRPVRVGSVQVGGGAPVSVQSMCTTKTDDPASTLEQIGRLADAGCEIVRVAIPTAASSTAPNLPTIAVIKAPAIMTPDISSITGQESPTTRRSNTQSLFFMNFLPASKLARIPSQL